MDDYRMALPSDGIFSYTWTHEDGTHIGVTVNVFDVSEARQEGLDLLDRVYDYKKTLDMRKIIETTSPILIGPYTGPVFY
jgi:hypothetical protein